MGKTFTNEDIVKKFVETKAIDFRAIGNLVTEMGPELARQGTGQRMVVLGKAFIIACIMPAPELSERIDDMTNIDLAATLMKG